MKKIIILVIILCTTFVLIGCNADKKTEYKVHTRYTICGHYYINGTVITSDGNIWDYTTDTISNKPSFDNQAVYVAFDDNGTPDDIYDDIILGFVWDINTTIYDRLETELSEDFDIERNGNEIKIKEIK